MGVVHPTGTIVNPYHLLPHHPHVEAGTERGVAEAKDTRLCSGVVQRATTTGIYVR